ncbi:hypothetical protein PAXRUDRAFT_307896 [Paxillus rubicundulus Ve08.2h10]|uniref:GPI ethanolamine phosphate transferase 1 n=1 Tax=Paxillus rubicundulus Ve08.2h10 TaxID=930991 RepID=A0A0D0E016_9AGAM|nr:hypothetical protein PAXRUDRAFT_307896 [Paxillus rubicundulus Ve08.2h10]
MEAKFLMYLSAISNPPLYLDNLGLRLLLFPLVLLPFTDAGSCGGFAGGPWFSQSIGVYICSAVPKCIIFVIWGLWLVLGANLCETPFSQNSYLNVIQKSAGALSSWGTLGLHLGHRGESSPSIYSRWATSRREKFEAQRVSSWQVW